MTDNKQVTDTRKCEPLTAEIFNELIRKSVSICIIGHTNPDGDSTGSVLGAYNYIKNVKEDMGYAIIIPCLMEPSPKFAFMNGYDDISDNPSVCENFDLAIVCDCADPARMGKFGKCLESAEKVILIDHHVTNTGFGDYCLIKDEASSASELIFGLMEPEYIDKETAECIYTGLVHDTGVFRHSCTAPSTMYAAAECMSRGINFTKIIEESFFSMSFRQKKMLGYLLSNLKYAIGGKMVYSWIDNAKKEELGIESPDMEGMVDNIRTTDGAMLGVFLYETKDNKVKASMRSNTDEIDVSVIAALYGGGGHKRAAGCFMDRNFEKDIAEIEAEVRKQLGKADVE